MWQLPFSTPREIPSRNDSNGQRNTRPLEIIPPSRFKTKLTFLLSNKFVDFAFNEKPEALAVSNFYSPTLFRSIVLVCSPVQRENGVFQNKLRYLFVGIMQIISTKVHQYKIERLKM